MTAASPVSDQPVVDMRGVTRSFPGDPPVVAVRDVDLRIGAGDHVSIVGPSGSGKSTLLHLIGLLDAPTSGRYRLAGIDTGSTSERERARIRCVTIGFVFQAFHLLPYRNVLDNVLVGVAYSDVPRRGRRADALGVLDRVGLSHRRDALPTTLSGGERQRVAFGRALLMRPRLLLLDEPLASLDARRKREILPYLEKLRDEVPMVYVSHHAPELKRIATSVVLLDAGRVAATGGIEVLDAATAELMG